MNLIVGLGNPERSYRDTRHNVGFIMIDRLVSHLSLAPFKPSNNFQAELTRLDDADHHWFFAKPGLFMNESGQSVAKLVHFYRLALDNLLIIHDDLDLPLGEVRLVFDRGPAGHNGVKSIIESLGSQAFYRLRVGIGTNRETSLPAEDYVLQKMTTEEQRVINEAFSVVLDEILRWAK